MPIDFSTLPPELAATIPADLQSDKSIARYNSLPDLLKGHVELDSYRGRSIAMPNGEAKPEELDAWAGEQSAKLKDRGFTISKIGELAPADPTAYQFKVEGIDDTALAQDKVVETFRGVAHKLGLNQSQAQGMIEAFKKDLAPLMAAPEPEFITGQEVHQLIDKTFPGQTEAVVENYKRSIDHLKVNLPDLPDILLDGVATYEGKHIALGDHPTIVKLISELAKVTAQDFGGNLNGTAQLSKDGAALVADAQDIIKNPDNPKHKLYLSGDAATHAAIQDAFAKAYPGSVNI